MPEKNRPAAEALLEKINRQFNECNALYHDLAVHYGISDTVFWILYALYKRSGPQTQNNLCMEWALPKQTMNSAVASMVRQELLELEQAPGRRSGKILHLTAAGQELAEKIIVPVQQAEQTALEHMGRQKAEQYVCIAQEYLNATRTEFEQILEQEKL